ncbi:MAG: hypothetical protein JO132_21160 [Streptosporangiaceae bacterium]|nr:hypothetical protein [Streptosporangiaceae bacterium]
MPAPAGRSFMVSLAARRGAAAALTSYNSLRAGRTRIARRVLGLGLRAGLAQPLIRDKIDIGIAADATDAQLGDDLLDEHLRLIFGGQRVVTAFGGGSGPYRKPVLQVFSTDGTPLGYIKVGWNDWTRAAVSREAAALRACAARPLRLGVPEFLGLSAWRGLDLLITGPLPRDSRRLSRSGLPLASVLREIATLAPGLAAELAASPWWLGVRSRTEAAALEPTARSALNRVIERIERRYGPVPLTFGAWHGDLVPWNLARSGSRLYAWDWEYSTQNAPLGFDAVHYYFQVAFVAGQRPLGEAAALAANRAAAALRALGLPDQAHRLVALLHLLELAVRHEEARSSTGDVDERFYPAVTDVLQQALAQPGGLAGPRTAGRAA